MQTLDLETHGDDLADRSASSPAAAARTRVIDAVGMEAHGAPSGGSRTDCRRCCPTRSPARSCRRPAIDRLEALHIAIDLVRRGGTVSISGVYGGAIDPMPMIQMFDKQIRSAWARRTSPLGRRPHADGRPRTTTRSASTSFATHHVPLEEAPHAYEMFQKKEDGAFKVVLKP